MSCCCVDRDLNDVDVVDLKHEKNIPARKPEKCVECGAVIEKGQIHRYENGLSNGKWVTYRTCIPCFKIRQEFCCSWVWGEVLNDVQECLDDASYGLDDKEDEEDDGWDWIAGD